MRRSKKLLVLWVTILGITLVTLAIPHAVWAYGDCISCVDHALYSKPTTSTVQLEPGAAFSQEEALPVTSRTRATLPRRPSTSTYVLEVFTNTWSYSTIGLVYDPDRDLVRYAHESQSSRHNPTIYDVEPSLTHTVALSFALSTVNSGWPWQIDNRDGAGYDPVAQTYFLPDYNGDLSYADDNIVEIDASGRILNAWEMDDEVGSNDSSDGSEIDTIIDIAVVPGAPPRYFVVAAYDDNIVYEIVLTRTGTLWTPNSWATVALYTETLPCPTCDNLGIDYDAQNQQLFHSSWDTTTVLITDLEMNVITDTLDCPGVGGYNSGVTYIEGSDPPEIWVTDFSSDKTTRCALRPPKVLSPDAAWDKTVNGLTWREGLTITSETTATVYVTDIITAGGEPFTLTERWDSAHLALRGFTIVPPLAKFITGTGALTVTGSIITPDVVTVTKLFQTQPCTWTHTIVSETLVLEQDVHISDTLKRPFTVTKLAPQLGLSSRYVRNVLPGSIVTFTLSYSNTGGYENDVRISNTFPISAPFVYADPSPDRLDPNRLWAEWDVGDLPGGTGGEIAVYVYISHTLTTNDVATIWDSMYDHVGEVADTAVTEFEVLGTAPEGWTKTVNGVPWTPAISVTEQLTGSFEVVDVISVSMTSSFDLIELWNPDHLSLESYSVEPSSYDNDTNIISQTGGLNLVITAPIMDVITLTKIFFMRPCTWTQTLLWEQFMLQEDLSLKTLYRPVPVYKIPPHLELTGQIATPNVYAGQSVSYTLHYSNTGGYESPTLTLKAEFPPEVTFDASEPLLPSPGGLGDSIIEWELPGGLSTGQSGLLTVTVAITDAVPPETLLSIENGFSDHAGVLRDTAIITYRTSPPAWDKWVNGQPWAFDQQTTVQVGDIFTVTDVMISGAGFTLVDRWPADKLTLLAAQSPEGSVLSTTGRMTWTVTTPIYDGAEMVRRFQVRAFTETYTVLWEDLSSGGEEWERRPVLLDNLAPDISLLKVVTPTTVPHHSAVTYTVTLSNGGRLEDTAAVMTDTLSPGVTFGRWVVSQTGTLRSGRAITWTGNISIGERITWTFTAHHIGDYGERITNTAYFSNAAQTEHSAAPFVVQEGYTLTVHITGTGGGAVSGSASGIACGADCTERYGDGTVVSLTAAPLISSTFTEWHGAVAGSANPVTLTIDANKAVTATFALKDFVITPTAGVGGSITPDTPQTVLYGDDITFTIGVDVGYYIANVWVDGASQGSLSSYTFNNVTAHHTISAAFALDTFIITPTVGTGGSITPDTSQTVSYGEDISFTIAADTNAGYHIANVWVDGAPQGPLSSYTFNNVTAHHTISAAFALNAYPLTVNVVGSGAVTRQPSQTTYVHGSVVTLTATPEAGWYFGQWSGDARGILTQTQVTMDAAKVVTATFVSTPPTYYTLTMRLAGSGVIMPDVGAHPYLADSVVDLHATPDTGWYFTGWTGDLVSRANPVQITMDADKVVTATFSTSPPPPLITYTLTLYTVGSGSVTRSPTGTVILPSQSSYISGTLVTVTAEPEAGWAFDAWSGDLSGATNPAQVPMDTHKAITATFTAMPPGHTVYLPIILRGGLPIHR